MGMGCAVIVVLGLFCVLMFLADFWDDFIDSSSLEEYDGDEGY